MRLRVADICPESRVYRPDGEKVRREIERLWRDDTMLEVDFEGLRVSSVSFLDEAIAVLFLDHSPDLVRRRLRPINLRPTDRGTLNRQIELRLREAQLAAAGR